MSAEVENKSTGHLLMGALKHHASPQLLICIVHVCVGRVGGGFGLFWWFDYLLGHSFDSRVAFWSLQHQNQDFACFSDPPPSFLCSLNIAMRNIYKKYNSTIRVSGQMRTFTAASLLFGPGSTAEKQFTA